MKRIQKQSGRKPLRFLPLVVAAALALNSCARAATVCILDSGSGLPGAAGWNLLDDNADVTDESGHGSAIHELVVKTSPAASVVVLKCFRGGQSRDEAAILAALREAVAVWQADVVCMSWTLGTPSEALREAVQAASESGAVLVAAAGNLSMETGLGCVCYPAAWPEVIGVGGVDVDAAGEPEASLWYLASEAVFVCARGDWAGERGASFAAARVAGLAAELLDSGVAAQDVPQALKGMAQDAGDAGWDPVFGWGYVACAP